MDESLDGPEGEDSGEPPDMTGPETGPFYNVLLEQNNERLSAPAVLDGVPLSVTFYLGAVHAESALPAEESPVIPELRETLVEANESELLVHMTCWICEGQPTQSQLITYDNFTKTSNNAIFEVTPSFAQTKKENGIPSSEGDITFALFMDGRSVDNVLLETRVIREGE